jgi:diguanylate cyclase (GGDEF)-like protein
VLVDARSPTEECVRTRTRRSWSRVLTYGTYDREQARTEVLRAQLDHLTGAYGRELGMVTLEREINRAQHGKGHLVLAFIDVDGLKQVNDRHGHAAGDELLRDVVAAIQTHLRSYDPIVRVGGDEFVCALADSQPDEARRRFKEIQATIQQLQPAASISVGYAQLRPKDTLDELTKRGDAALYAAKLTKSPPVSLDPLRLLMVEDSAEDADLVAGYLRMGLRANANASRDGQRPDRGAGSRRVRSDHL